MIAVDLFAGAGGFSTGAVAAGCTVAWAANQGRALMGFPDTYRLPANEATAWHLIGNAVAPTVAADVINALRATA